MRFLVWTICRGCGWLWYLVSQGGCRATPAGLNGEASEVRPLRSRRVTVLDDQTLLDRLRATTELLESMAADDDILATVPVEERRRLMEAVALVHSPDRSERRRLARIKDRERKAARVRRDEGLLAQTGIRKMGAPMVHTPKVFPPAGFEPLDKDARHAEADAPTSRTTSEPQPCYVCKQPYSVVHHFYDQLCPPCAELNFAKRSELADLRGRVALLTGGRVKIGYQAGLKCCRGSVWTSYGGRRTPCI